MYIIFMVNTLSSSVIAKIISVTLKDYITIFLHDLNTQL